jgi:L-asparaginase
LATGGTIAGEGRDAGAPDAYRAGVLSVHALLTAVPMLSNVAHVQAEQIANIDSKDMTIELWKKLVQRVNQLLESDAVHGIVITHGTDTLEETAYFLHLTVKNKKPVVLTAAMRPATALSADGPVNLLNATVVAASKKSIGQGVLVVINNQIYSAHDVTKTNTYSVDTFRSNEFGALGWVQGNQAHFQRSITGMHTNTTESQFNIDQWSELSSVEIIMSYAAPSRATIDAFAAKGVKGIVIAGTGDGTIHSSLEEAAVDAVKKGIAVVRSSRVCYGHVTHDTYDDQVGFLSAGTLNPWKARVLLMLILTEGITDYARRQGFFDNY